MKNKNFKTFTNIYAIVLLLASHIIAYMIYMYDTNQFEKPLGDIILITVVGLLGYMFCNIAFLLPFFCLMSCVFLISVTMSLSILIFLFLSLIETLGSNGIELLQYGFFNILLGCIIATPIGIMNLIALYRIYNEFDDNSEY
jgi:hypothetical protein